MNHIPTLSGTCVLGTLRRFARRAWLLHGYMIAALILLPAQPQLLRADDPPEETWGDPVAQSSLSVTIDTPDGSSFTSTGSAIPFTLTVMQNSWTVQTSSLGNTNISEVTSTPVSGSVVFSTSGGPAAVSAATSFTDGSLSGSVTPSAYSSFTLDATVTVAGLEPSTASCEFNFQEEWSLDHSEATITATLTAPQGTEGVSAGDPRVVSLHADYQTWDVYVSNAGGSETRNFASSPAAGASLSWSVAGDGSLSSYPPEQLDASGNAEVTLTMGSADSTLQAALSYYNSSATTTASITFTTPAILEEWTYDHSEGSTAVSLSVDGGTTGLESGTTRTVTAEVTFSAWDVYVSNLGNTETRNWSSGPAINATVDFSLSSGDGYLNSSGNSSVQATTDGNGRASVTFGMGAQDAGLNVSAGYLASSASASTSFQAPAGPVWSKLSTVEELNVSVSASGTAASVPISATVALRTWEIWGNNQNSDTRIENDTTSTAVNAPTSASVTSGNGYVSSSMSSTDSSGNFEAVYAAASQQSVVTVSASFTTTNGTVYGSGSVSISNLDTDGDAYSDADEVAAGTNPNDAGSKPGGGGGGEDEYEYKTIELPWKTWEHGLKIREERKLVSVEYTVEESGGSSESGSFTGSAGGTLESWKAEYTRTTGTSAEKITRWHGVWTWVPIGAPEIWGMDDPMNPEKYTSAEALQLYVDLHTTSDPGWTYVSHTIDETPMSEVPDYFPPELEEGNERTRVIHEIYRWKMTLKAKKKKAPANP